MNLDVIQAKVDELELSIAELQKQFDRSAKLVQKMAVANNQLIDIICDMNGFDVKQFIMERKEDEPIQD